MTDVAWSTLAHPTTEAASDAEADDPGTDDAEADDAEADDVTGADEVAGAPAGFETAADAQPATTEHSSTASTVPRTWRGDIMLVGRTPQVISSITVLSPDTRCDDDAERDGEQQQGEHRLTLP